MKPASPLEEALALHRAGRIAEAQARYRAILEAEPRHASALHLLGVAALQTGRPAEAVGLIERAIAERGDQAAYHANLGNALRALERDDAAIAAYRRAVALDGNATDAMSNLAIALRARGALDEARELLERACALEPGNPRLLNNLANTLDGLGEPARALELYRRALELDPDYAEAYTNLGRALLARGDFAQAAQYLERAAALAPPDARLHDDLGAALVKAGRLGEAERALRRAIELDPALASPVANLGVVRQRQFRYEEAIAQYRRALELDPSTVTAENGIGAALASMGRFAEALPHFQRQVAAHPGHVEGHVNLGITLLTLGRFAEGWPEYERRLEKRGFNAASGPRWRGEPLGRDTLLVWPEQGAGDNIQFLRYLRRVRAAHPEARIVYPSPAALERLFAQSLAELGVEVPGALERIEVHGFQTALLSLPALFGTTLEDIPAAVPYLAADPALRAGWAARLRGRPAPRVGVVWAGNPEFAMDRDRSVPPETMREVLECPRTCFVSLQKPAANVLRPEPRRGELLDWMHEVADFADTAALVSELDLVVSVDTSVAHLAGALGKPVWLLNRAATDWRWLLGREDSPWYPSMRIFRQPRAGDWTSVARAVRRELEALSAARA